MARKTQRTGSPATVSGDHSRIETAATVIVWLRFPIVAAWIAAAVAATMTLPTLSEAKGAALGSLVPEEAPALRAEIRSVELFGIPLLTRTAVVQRDELGLSARVHRRLVDRALDVNERRLPEFGGIRFALPITNVFEVFPASREHGSTAVTYLFFERERGLLNRDRLASRFVRETYDRRDAVVGVTGAVPANVEQGRLIKEALPLIELSTVLVIALVLGLHFRSPGPPLVALAAVAVAYTISTRIVAFVGTKAGLAVPQEVEPLIVVLLLGIVTDYSIFFLSGARHRLAAGEPRVAAAERTTRDFLAIILTAGLIVAAGTAALVAGTLGFFRAFGPGMAVTTLVGLLVATTFVPALIAVLGRALFWPSLRRIGADEERAERSRARSRRVTELVTGKRGAVVVLVLVLAALLAAASGLRHLSLGLSPISGLPEGSEPKRAAEAATIGFAPGIVSPTQIVVEGPDIVLKRVRLAALEFLLEHEPGVAAVVGPADQPTRRLLGAVLAPTGNAARYVVILNKDPFSADAIHDLRTLQRKMPRLLASVGLEGNVATFSGDTALASETVETIVGDLKRIAVAVLVVNLLLLVVFLRSLVAPLYLLAASVLALAATLGLTTYVFQTLLGQDQITYFVPFAVAVLLVSLGSDYNVLVVGRVWQETRDRPLREALRVAVPRASRVITIAAIALAAGFALLAIVPLGSFREFAFAMVVGVLVDAFVVRSFLVPALIAAVGEVSWWPSRRRRRAVRAPA